MSNDMKEFMAVMTQMARAGSKMSNGQGFVCGFGFIASPGEDARAAEAFAANLLKSINQDKNTVDLDQGRIIDGVCQVLPVGQKRLR